MDDINKEEIVDNIRLNGKTRKGNAILKKREGEFNEDSKYTLIICGNKRTELLKEFLQDIYMLQKPLTCYKPKKNPKLVNIYEKFDEVTKQCVYNRCSFFLSVLSNKKNPSRFILGRLYNNKIMDHYTFHILSFIPQKMFPLAKEVEYDTKPIVLCQGSYFEKNETTKYVRNILFDFFKHKNVQNFSRESLQRLIVISSVEKENGSHVLSFRQYLLKKEFFNILNKEKISLDEIGPRFDFSLLDAKTPEHSTFQEALKTPKVHKKRKGDKARTDELGNNINRIYVQKQDFNKLHTKHNKIHKNMKKNWNEN